MPFYLFKNDFLKYIYKPGLLEQVYCLEVKVAHPEDEDQLLQEKSSRKPGSTEDSRYQKLYLELMKSEPISQGQTEALAEFFSVEGEAMTLKEKLILRKKIIEYMLKKDNTAYERFLILWDGRKMNEEELTGEIYDRSSRDENKEDMDSLDRLLKRSLRGDRSAEVKMRFYEIIKKINDTHGSSSTRLLKGKCDKWIYFYLVNEIKEIAEDSKLEKDEKSKLICSVLDGYYSEYIRDEEKLIQEGKKTLMEAREKSSRSHFPIYDFVNQDWIESPYIRIIRKHITKTEPYSYYVVKPKVLPIFLELTTEQKKQKEKRDKYNSIKRRVLYGTEASQEETYADRMDEIWYSREIPEEADYQDELWEVSDRSVNSRYKKKYFKYVQYSRYLDKDPIMESTNLRKKLRESEEKYSKKKGKKEDLDLLIEADNELIGEWAGRRFAKATKAGKEGLQLAEKSIYDCLDEHEITEKRKKKAEEAVSIAAIEDPKLKDGLTKLKIALFAKWDKEENDKKAAQIQQEQEQVEIAEKATKARKAKEDEDAAIAEKARIEADEEEKKRIAAEAEKVTNEIDFIDILFGIIIL